MQFRKIANGIRVYINLEEQALVEMLEASKESKLYKTELSEKQAVLSNQLVNKSIFRRRKDDTGLYYTLHEHSK
jgi:hypothetical protein